MSAERPVQQAALFADEQNSYSSPEAFVDAMEQRFSVLFCQSQESQQVLAEQHILSSILLEIYTYPQWHLSPLPGLIYQREQFRRGKDPTMSEEEYGSLDHLYEQAIAVYTTDPAERAYFERKQRER